MLCIGLAACAHGKGASEASYVEAPAPHERAAASSTTQSSLSTPAPVLDAHGTHASAVAQAGHAHTEQGESADAPAVTLVELLVHADGHAPLLVVARATRSRADAARVAAEIALPTNPELRLAAGPRFGASDSSLDFSAELTQKLEIAGERGMRIAEVDKLHKLTDAEIEVLRWAVHCDVHAAFHLALVERERMLLAQRVVAFQEDVLRIVQRQIEAGEAAPFALRLAQAEAAQARQQRVASEHAFLGCAPASSSTFGLAFAAASDATRQPRATHAAAGPGAPARRRAREAAVLARRPSTACPQRSARGHGGPGALAGAERRRRIQSRRRHGRRGHSRHRDGCRRSAIAGVPEQPGRARGGACRGFGGARRAGRCAGRARRRDCAKHATRVVAAAERTSAYGTEILPRFEENLALLGRSFELGELDLLALSTGRERFLRIQSDALPRSSTTSLRSRT